MKFYLVYQIDDIEFQCKFAFGYLSNVVVDWVGSVGRRAGDCLQVLQSCARGLLWCLLLLTLQFSFSRLPSRISLLFLQGTLNDYDVLALNGFNLCLQDLVNAIGFNVCLQDLLNAIGFILCLQDLVSAIGFNLLLQVLVNAIGFNILWKRWTFV